MLNDLYKKITGKMSAVDRHKKNIKKTLDDVDDIMNMGSTNSTKKKPVKGRK